jgi:glyoxylase-like metal-dependent hydrolase (beta-lactamase superfamily II)
MGWYQIDAWGRKVTPDREPIWMEAAVWLDIPMAESGGPFRPLTPVPGPLRRMLCQLFFHPEERVAPVAIDQYLNHGEILAGAGGFKQIHLPGHCAGQVALLWRNGRMLSR